MTARTRLVTNLIAGRTITGKSSSYVVTHPIHGPVHDAQRSTTQDIRAAIDISYKARRPWRMTALKERQKVVHRAAELLSYRKTGWATRLRDTNLLETTVSPWWSEVQTVFLPNGMRCLANEATEALAPATVAGDSCEFTLDHSDHPV